MNLVKNIKKIAQDVLLNESHAIQNLTQYIDDNFEACVQEIYSAKGRVVITGIGKSAIIANKIVATLNSTGTPALFMHAADAIHGDLGMIQQDDIVICISKSGNTPEIKVLVPLLKRRGSRLVALVSNVNSYLAKQADYILNATIGEEACPNNLAPTTSTTAHLAMGDALAACLLELRNFSSEAVILEITSRKSGCTSVAEADRKLLGIITDGDLRRMLQKNVNLNEVKAAEIMTKNPRRIEKDEFAVRALHMMQENSITQLVAMDGE